MPPNFLNGIPILKKNIHFDSVAIVRKNYHSIFGINGMTIQDARTALIFSKKQLHSLKLIYTPWIPKRDRSLIPREYAKKKAPPRALRKKGAETVPLEALFDCP